MATEIALAYRLRAQAGSLNIYRAKLVRQSETDIVYKSRYQLDTPDLFFIRKFYFLFKEFLCLLTYHQKMKIGHKNVVKSVKT